MNAEQLRATQAHEQEGTAPGSGQQQAPDGTHHLVPAQRAGQGVGRCRMRAEQGQHRARLRPHGWAFEARIYAEETVRICRSAVRAMSR